MAVGWAAVEGESVQEPPGSVRSFEARRLVQGIAAIDPHRAAPLRKRQEAEVALGADRLHILAPALAALDQQTGEPVMRRVLVQGDPSALPHLRRAAIGAYQQSGPGLANLAIVLERHAGRRTGLYLGHHHATQRLDTGRLGRIKQRLAVLGMADAKRPRHALAEHPQRQGLRFRLSRVDRTVIGDMLSQVMATGPDQQLIQSQPLDLIHAPRRDPLTPHPVLIDLRLLQQQHRTAGTRHHLRQRRSTDPAADDDQVVVLHTFDPVPVRHHRIMRTRRHPRDIAS